MNALKWLISRTFTYVALGLGALAVLLVGLDVGQLTMWFLIPFYVVGLLLQFVIPKVKAPLEKNELLTDVVSSGINIGVVNSLQTMILQIVFVWSSSSLLVHFGIVDETFGIGHLPLWLQAICAFLIGDFFFYVTHRIAHEVPFFWRFHSIHHCAHRVTFMNAYRVHPVDAMFRRYIPLFFILCTGITEEALAAMVVFTTIFSTVTHLNVDLRHGWLNYFIATNELHRWHHSRKYHEAKNFAIFTLWDHLMGTYYWPKDRSMPEEIGLGNETNFPLHNYWQMLLIPFRWKQFEESQKQASEHQPKSQASDDITENSLLIAK